MYARASRLGSCRVQTACKVARTAPSPGRVAVHASWCSCTACTDTGTPCACLLRVYICATFCTISLYHRQLLFSSHPPVGMTRRVICFPATGPPSSGGRHCKTTTGERSSVVRRSPTCRLIPLHSIRYVKVFLSRLSRFL